MIWEEGKKKLFERYVKLNDENGGKASIRKKPGGLRNKQAKK